MVAQDPHHPSPKAHHTPESDPAVQVLSGALQMTHDRHLKDNVKSTRHLHPLQVLDHPVHPSITHEGGRPGTTTHPPYNFPPSPSGTPPSSAGSSSYDRSAGPPPTTGSSTVTGGGEREYRRDRADEYPAPPPGGAANSYERPRSPTGGGAGRAPMQSYGGRGGYSRPSDPRDRGVYASSTLKALK